MERRIDLKIISRLIVMSNISARQFFLKLRQKLGKKKHLLKSFFAPSLFWLFLGFMGGNLFGTFLDMLRTFIVWDGAISC